MPNSHIQHTIELAKENVQNGGWPFATVIVKDGEVIAEAVNNVHKSNDPSDHAEVAAIRIASKALQSPDLSGCELYTIGIPCPMCATCIILSKITSVTYAVDVPAKDKALTKLPATDGLFQLISEGYGEKAINYHHAEEYKEEGLEVLERWNSEQD